jgi:hypothetical protein
MNSKNIEISIEVTKATSSCQTDYHYPNCEFIITKDWNSQCVLFTDAWLCIPHHTALLLWVDEQWKLRYDQWIKTWVNSKLMLLWCYQEHLLPHHIIWHTSDGNNYSQKGIDRSISLTEYSLTEWKASSRIHEQLTHVVSPHHLTVITIKHIVLDIPSKGI